MFPHNSDAAPTGNPEMNQEQWQMKKDAAASHSLPTGDACNARKAIHGSDYADSAKPAVAAPSCSDPRYRTCEWALPTERSKSPALRRL
jgi:hypothetical protein